MVLLVSHVISNCATFIYCTSFNKQIHTYTREIITSRSKQDMMISFFFFFFSSSSYATHVYTWVQVFLDNRIISTIIIKILFVQKRKIFCSLTLFSSFNLSGYKLLRNVYNTTTILLTHNKETLPRASIIHIIYIYMTSKGIFYLIINPVKLVLPAVLLPYEMKQQMHLARHALP